MNGRISTAIILTVIATLLIACSKEPPKCSDDRTTSLVRKIILDQISGNEGLTDYSTSVTYQLSEKEIQENMKLEFPRASALDEKIKKYSCEAKLVVGGTHQLPITYESQLDDKNQHIVAVGGIRQDNLSGLKFALIESIKKSRPIKSEAPPPPTKIYDKTQTRYGLISITIRGDDWRTGNIYINKVKIPIDEASISVKEKWEIGSKDVLLVSRADGGSACPSLYVFLIVTEKQVLASEEFGTCSDIPEVSRIKDTIIVKLPQMGGDGVETTKYEDGKVYGIVTRWVNDHNVSKPGELKLETIAF